MTGLLSKRRKARPTLASVKLRSHALASVRHSQNYLIPYRELTARSPGLFNNRICRGRTATYPYLLGVLWAHAHSSN
jgi:hypothetical protein